MWKNSVGVFFGVQTIKTNSFETTFIWDFGVWDHNHMRLLHLRPRSFEISAFETTITWDFYIWDHIHLRPIYLRPHSFQTTFIWHNIHMRSHSFYATLKWSCFDLLCIRFLGFTFHFFVGGLKFCKVTFHLRFCDVTPFRVQGWLTLGCKPCKTSGLVSHENVSKKRGLKWIGLKWMLSRLSWSQMNDLKWMISNEWSQMNWSQ